MAICNSHSHQTTSLPILQYLVIKGKDLTTIFDNLMKATPGYVSYLCHSTFGKDSNQSQTNYLWPITVLMWLNYERIICAAMC
jgi:hypothetical protein